MATVVGLGLTLPFNVLSKPITVTLADPVYITLGSAGYSKTGTWLTSSLTSYNGSATEYTQTIGDTATWSIPTYAPVTGNYDVFVWFPTSASNAASVEYKITSPDGTWVRTVNQQSGGGGWYKLATVSAQAGAGLIVTMKALVGGGGSNNTRSGAVQFANTLAAAEAPGASSAGQDTTTVAAFVNQSGYDYGRPKHATITNVADGTAFTIKQASDNAQVWSGSVSKQIADFSGFNPTGATVEYYVECNGIKSDNFKIGRFLMARISTPLVVKSMIESRSDTWKLGSNSIVGRDGHQFSNEVSSMAWFYAANPAAFDRMAYGVTHLSDSKFTSLRTQAEPDIIWYIKFGAMVYYDLVVNQSKQLHALSKAQLAYFLHLYPDIKQWVDATWYGQVRDMTVAQWSVSGVSADLQWYDVGTSTDNNLLATQSTYSTDVKGAQPPGYAILPNLLMYEVATRDGLTNPQQYMDAAVANATWLVGLDLNVPNNTKGQRMSEHVTMTGLAYMLERYPAQAPAGTQAKIDGWITKMIARSNNMWEFRKFSDTAAGDATDQWTVGTANDPGSVAGFPAAAFAARRVAGTAAQKTRLMELAVSQIDHVFGRNPFGRHFSHDAATEIEGVERGWATEYPGVGAGDLALVPGILDGSPKESAYPFAPTADPGSTEGWVAFQAAWITGLAYSTADEVEVKVFDSTYTTELTTAAAGTTIGIRLRAALNFNPAVQETGTVDVTTNSGTRVKVTVTEEGTDGEYFKGTHTVPADATYIDVSYGYGLFKKSVRVTIGEGGGTPPDTTAPAAPTNLAYGTPTTTTVPLTWTASVSSDVAGYRIEYGSTVLDIGNVTSYTVTGLTPNTSYTFTVKAKDAVPNISAASNAVTVSTASSGVTHYSQDNFDAKAGTTGLGVDQTGKTWQIRSGAGGVGSADTINAYFSSANSLATIPVGQANCNLQVKYRAAGTGNVGGRIIFRYVDSTNYWFVENVSTGPALKKLVAGTYTTLGSTTTPVAQDDVIRVELNGDNITVYRNGVVEIATVTDSAHNTSTNHGLGVAGATTARFDEWDAYSLS